jgi:flavin reductase (DIM6/NTAB) family NADH-FMN oxidoreductase RutF
MTKKMIEGAGKLTRHYPANVAIVTTRTETEQDAMAAAWHSCISFKPPLVGVSVSMKRHTHKLISRSKKFAMNYVPSEKSSISAETGGVSGRDVDKFEMFGYDLKEETGLDLPILKDAYAAYECKLHSVIELGDHDWFVGEVMYSHYDEEAFSEDQMLLTDKISPTMYLGFDHYLLPPTSKSKHLERSKLLE